MNRKPALLPGALLANAAFSGACGAVLLGFPSWWSRLFGVLEVSVYAVLGAGLLGFAAILIWILMGLRERSPHVRWIIAADFAWVLATPPVMLLGTGVINSTAQYLLFIVAAVVALLAILQWHGMNNEY